MRNLILGIIDNYRFSDIDPFLLSLKKAMATEHVCLYAGPNINRLTVKKIRARGVEVISYGKQFPFVSTPHPDNVKSLPQPIHIYNFRHFLYYDYLLKHGSKFEKVLITDVKDVVFQNNPFNVTIEEKIYVAVENISILIEGCKCTSKWIRKGYGDEIVEVMKKKEVICAGTTLAPVTLMKRYLLRLIQEFSVVKEVYRCADQAMHNVLLHQNKIGPVFKCYNFKGPILTVGTEPSYFLNKQRQLIDEKGVIIPIVHQYDRHKELVDIFKIKPTTFGRVKNLMEDFQLLFTLTKMI